MFRNIVTKAVLELIGDPTQTGYCLFYQGQEIPILLNKDKTTQYPQIRVSPFISGQDMRYENLMSDMKNKYRSWEMGTFQIDIFCKDIILANDLYDVLKQRLYDFFHLETLLFDYNNDFTPIGDYTYHNITYALLDDDMFKDVYGITVDGKIMNRVQIKDSLTMDSYYVDDKSLYIKTNNDLKKINIKMLLQGRLFSNGFAYSDYGLHDYRLSDPRNLSGLEDNEVERISFDLDILYSNKIQREKLPKINQVKIKTHVE